MSTIRNKAREALRNPRTVILDTETTGFGKAYIVEIAILAQREYGGVLLNTFIDPIVPITSSASRTNKIYTSTIRGKPRFIKLAAGIANALEGKTILAWNASFDSGILENEIKRMLLMYPNTPGVEPTAKILRSLHWEDPCQWYRDWLKERNLYEYGAAKLNGPHRALGDCRAVISKLREMAAK